MLKNIVLYFISILAHYHEKKIISKLNLLNFYPKYIAGRSAHWGNDTNFFKKFYVCK